MEGGELFNRIQERADSAFTERGMYNIFFWSLKKNLVNDGSQLSNKFYQINKYFVIWWAVCSILTSQRDQRNLRRNGTPPLFDVLPFEINNENYFLFINLWVARSNHAPVLLFISLVEFYKWIFGQMLQILKFLKPWL